MYLCLCFDNDDDNNHTTPEPTQALFVSPRFMLWDAHTWIIDLRPVWSYWRLRAAATKYLPGCNDSSESDETDKAVLNYLYNTVLLTKLGDAFSFCVAQHPWQVLLQKKLHTPPLTWRKNLDLNCVSWTQWFTKAEQLIQLDSMTQAQRYAAKRHLLLFRRSIERLQIPSPQSFVGMQSTSILRRFGQFVAMLWEWTQLTTEDSNYADFFFNADHGFPWISWQTNSPPFLQRILDAPVWEWDHLVSMLHEDFVRIQHTCTNQECLVLVRWILTLEDMQTVELCLRFRNPLPCYADAEIENKTTRALLAQARIAWNQQLTESNADHCIPGSASGFVRPIIAWKIELSEILLVETQFVDTLFAKGSSNTSRSLSALADLENLLPVAIQRFDLCADWLPETSFYPHKLPIDSELQALITPPLLHLADKRPLFILSEITPYAELFPNNANNSPGSGGLQFLERVSDKWWLDSSDCVENLNHEERTYYSVLDEKNRSYWVFKDLKGKWYVHGIFA